MVDFLIQYGYWGMFLAAFLAASVFPFSSEAVMVGLQLAGLDPLLLLVWGTIGNVGGSMFNYSIGRLGRMEWVEKYLRVKRESVEKAQHWMERKGAWVGGILCVVPVIGDAISVALGFMRANWLICLISITIGKLVRYAILVYTVTLFNANEITSLPVLPRGMSLLFHRMQTVRPYRQQRHTATGYYRIYRTVALHYRTHCRRRIPRGNICTERQQPRDLRADSRTDDETQAKSGLFHNRRFRL